MAYGKRKFGAAFKRPVRSNVSYKTRVKRARRMGTTGYAGIMRASARLAPKVDTLYRMIETKESSVKTGQNVGLPHNNVTIVQDALGGDFNVFNVTRGTGDPLSGVGNIIGDQISLKGIKLVFFLENALERTKVHYRMMLVRCPRGIAPDRAALFKGCSNNKMIDMVNTEKFTIVWQTRFNVQVANGAANAVTLTGVPYQTVTSGGQGTRLISAWIPGKKFGRNGKLVFESGTAIPKFYDYKLVILAYDWFGTPQDANNVGKINEGYTKLYYKDA